MKKRILAFAVGMALLLSACQSAAKQQDTPTASPEATAQPTETPETEAVPSAEPEIGDTTDYTDPDNWMYCGETTASDAVSIFFVAPTNVGGDENTLNADITDEKNRSKILAATKMEVGLYSDVGSFYAPYYRQGTLSCYTASEEEETEALDLAYQDIRAAFQQFLQEIGDEQPILLAGFSQGADMCLRLQKEFFAEEAMQKRLVADYAIGWRLTEQETEEYPWLVPAQGEDDCGTIVLFDCESEDVTDTLIVPADVCTYSINPLNWKTDSTPADASLNEGACFLNGQGEITQEIPGLCGCYRDEERGTIKVTGVAAEEYPARLGFLPDGAFHIYDYQFFYRNLQENVAVRTAAYLAASEQAAA